MGPPLWSPIDTAFLGFSPLYRLYMPTPDRYLEVHGCWVGVAGPHVLGGQPEVEVMLARRGVVGRNQRHSLLRCSPKSLWKLSTTCLAVL